MTLGDHALQQRKRLRVDRVPNDEKCRDEVVLWKELQRRAGALPPAFSAQRCVAEDRRDHQDEKSAFRVRLGPIDQPSAERLRWALLEKGGFAHLVEGADHLGDPRPLD
jgi:hypothetical protein